MTASTLERTSEQIRAQLTPEQLEAFGAELDEIRRRVVADLGEEDARYIYNVVKAQRAFEVAGPRCCGWGSCPRRGWPAPRPCPSPRSSTTWRSATT
jgi:hypothetical protein